MLRKFDRGELADQLIDEHIDLHRDELSKLKSTAELIFPLGDSRLTQGLDRLIASLPDTRTLCDTIKRINSSDSFHVTDLEFLAKSTVDSYYEFFKIERSPELRLLVKRLLDFGHDASSEHKRLIAVKATDALRRLASESRINRIRVQLIYGVTVPEDDSFKATPLTD